MNGKLYSLYIFSYASRGMSGIQDLGHIYHKKLCTMFFIKPVLECSGEDY